MPRFTKHEKYRILVLEGGDCGGKTTLLNELEKKLNIRNYPLLKFHNGPYSSPYEAYKSYVRQLNSSIVFLAENPNGYVIFDRAYLSSLVYGLLVDKDIMTTVQFSSVDFLFETAGACTVLCQTENKELMLEKWNERLDMELIKDRDTMCVIYDLFDHVTMFNTSTDCHRYDYTITKVEHILKLMGIE